MDNMMITKKQTYTKPQSALAMRRDSHTISKTKPKIRIIHIFAPEIIKTDVENFRELVQRLTGKPSSTDHHNHHQKAGSKIKKIIKQRNNDVHLYHHDYDHDEDQPSTENCSTDDILWEKRMLMFSGFEGRVDADYNERVVKEEEEFMMWNSNINGGGHNQEHENYSSAGGGFFSGFGEFEGYIQELDEFPLIASHASSDNNNNHHHHPSRIHGFEEAQLLV